MRFGDLPRLQCRYRCCGDLEISGGVLKKQHDERAFEFGDVRELRSGGQLIGRKHRGVEILQRELEPDWRESAYRGA